MSNDGVKIMTDANDIDSVFRNFDVMFSPLGEECVSHPNVQKLLQSNEKFDVVIVTNFMPRILRGFAHYYNASLVLFVNVGLFTGFYDEVGNTVLPSIEPVLNINMPQRMSFWQRVENVFEKIKLVKWLHNDYYKQDKLIKKYFPNAASLDEITRNISLVLVNTHPSTEVVRPMVPSIINIGGYHVKIVKPPGKLPADLQQIMDNAKDGVIFFSFGSMIDSSSMSSQEIERIIEVLAKRKESVLWKFDENVPVKARNVIIRKWLPQQEILGNILLIS